MKGAGDEKKLCWTKAEKGQVQEAASPHDVLFLNPDDPITDPDNVLGQFGRDMYQIAVADAVIVDARERRGLGVGVEMAAAAAMGTTIIVVAPANSKYRADELHYRGAVVTNYIHPHVAALATHVVGDFTAAGWALTATVGRKRTPYNCLPWLDEAIAEYCDNVLPHDAPMLAALEVIEQIESV